MTRKRQKTHSTAPEALEAHPAAEDDGTPIAPDGSGWPPHPSERRDFLNRIRVFPPSVSTWRRRILERIRTGRPPLPISGQVDDDRLNERLDEGISCLREVARILAVLYGTPDLGNKADPTDELVYIILSRKTPEKAYQQTFASLKARFACWDDLLAAPREEVELLVRPGGLPGKKATSLFGALTKIQESFGRCSLEPARDWPDDRLEDFLCGLPEVQRKSAYCIMMYSFGREVFPADTHVGRVLSRVGPYRELGLKLEGLDHKKLQRVLADLIPPPLRYSLHVNLVEHGRDALPRGEAAVRPLRVAAILPVLTGSASPPASWRRTARLWWTCSVGLEARPRASAGPGSRYWLPSISTRWPSGPTASTTPACRTTGFSAKTSGRYRRAYCASSPARVWTCWSARRPARDSPRPASAPRRPGPATALRRTNGTTCGSGWSRLRSN